MAEPLDVACDSVYLDWWDGAGCPSFEQYVEALNTYARWPCDGAWEEAVPTSFIVHRCLDAADRADRYEVLYADCSTDLCYGRAATFGADGALLFFRSWESGRVPPLCCEETKAWAGRSWGTYVPLDCTDAHNYAPSDLASCGGAGLP